MRPENKVLHSADHGLTKLPQKSRHCSNKDQESRRNGDNESHVPAASVSRDRSRRVGRKPPRKRRKVKGDEPDSSPARNRSGSGSHDKGNSRVGVKQIKIAKDKYSLPRGGRRAHQNDVTNSHTQGNTSQGGNGEKTLKLVCKVGKDKSSANIEDKKRALEMMNETIRRNNLKQNGVSKDQRDHSSSQGGIYTSHTGPSSIFKKLLQSGAGLHHAEHSVEQSDMMPKMAQGKGEKPSSSAGLANKVFNTLTNPDSQKRKSPFGLSISPSGLPVNSL